MVRCLNIHSISHHPIVLTLFQAVGLVENQSDWYLGKLWRNHKPWPALVSKEQGFLLEKRHAVKTNNQHIFT